jgi:hypothetical protein
MQTPPVRLRLCRLTGRERRGEQTAFQGTIIQLRRRWPGNADRAGPTQVVGNRVAADADRRRDLLAAVASNIFEAKNLRNLTHRQSLASRGPLLD